MDNFSLASMASHKNIYFREVMTRDELWWIGPYLILLIHMIQIRTYLSSHSWQAINWRSEKCPRSKSLLLHNLHLLQEMMDYHFNEMNPEIIIPFAVAQPQFGPSPALHVRIRPSASPDLNVRGLFWKQISKWICGYACFETGRTMWMSFKENTGQVHFWVPQNAKAIKAVN